MTNKYELIKYGTVVSINNVDKQQRPDCVISMDMIISQYHHILAYYQHHNHLVTSLLANNIIIHGDINIDVSTVSILNHS